MWVLLVGGVDIERGCVRKCIVVTEILARHSASEYRQEIC